MTKRKPYYGEPPDVLAEEILVDLVKDKVEMCFYQYLPIKMAGALENFHIPPQLEWIKRFIPYLTFDPHTDYVYVTVKHLFVTPGNMGNRPGWHTDGFGSDDVNYIWTDRFPTQFALQRFNLSDDHVKSLKELEEQVLPENIFPATANAFIRIDKYNVHRPPTMGTGFRTFLKFSVSKNRYNLQGNSHNYLIDYDWEMVPREALRNHPTADVKGKVEVRVPELPEAIRSSAIQRSSKPERVGGICYDDRELAQYAEKAKTLIGFVKAPVTFNFAVHELLAIFKRFDVLQVPIAARLDSMEKYETLGQELTLEYFLRKLLVEKYGETQYCNQMQARPELLRKLYATGLFRPENNRSPEYLCTIPPSVRTRPFIFPRKVNCIRLADHVIEKLKQK